MGLMPNKTPEKSRGRPKHERAGPHAPRHTPKRKVTVPERDYWDDAPPPGTPSGSGPAFAPGAAAASGASPAAGAFSAPGAPDAAASGAPPVPAGSGERIIRIRMRKRMRKLRAAGLAAIALTALLAAVLAGVAGVYGASLALLGDVVDSVNIALTPGPGYPIAFTLSGFRSAVPLAGGFAAVGEQDLVLYAANGNELRRIQHGYGRPDVTAGNTRVCLYNRSGRELRVESRSRTLYESKFEDAIQLCAMSPNGSLAVFTRSKLLVYDPMFQNIYTFRTQELPTAMAFASDNRQLAVGCPYAEGGALGGTVYLMDTGRDEYITIRNTQGLPLKIQYLSTSEVLVLYDTFAAVYAASDGAQLYRFEYGGRTLQSAAVSADGHAVLLFGDGVHGAITQLTVLDAALAVTGAANLNERARSVAAGRTHAFVLTNDGVLCYGLDGAFAGAVVTEKKPLAAVDARQKILLLTQGQASELEPPGKADPTG